MTHISVSKITIIGSNNGLSPSHYLNQCWNIVNWALGNKLQWNLNRNLYIFIQENAFENVVWKMAAILSRPQCFKWHIGSFYISSAGPVFMRRKNLIINSTPPGQDGIPSFCTYFQMHFHELNILYFDSNFTEVCSFRSFRSNWQ